MTQVAGPLAGNQTPSQTLNQTLNEDQNPTPDAETEACPLGHRAESAEGAESAKGAYEQTPRTTATRYQSRMSYDRAAVHAVLDEALVCHLAFVLDDAPVVLPTVHARLGDRLYIHGSSGGRFASLDGQRVGVTVTLM